MSSTINLYRLEILVNKNEIFKIDLVSKEISHTNLFVAHNRDKIQREIFEKNKIKPFTIKSIDCLREIEGLKLR